MNTKTLLSTAGAVILAAGLGYGTASAQDMAPGEGLVMYMQMGGNAGDGATLARQTGAAQAAKALGVELKEQFSAWAPDQGPGSGHLLHGAAMLALVQGLRFGGRVGLQENLLPS